MEKSDLVIPIIDKITGTDHKMIESPFDAWKLRGSALPTTREIYELLYKEMRNSPKMLAKIDSSRKKILQTLVWIPESHNLMTHQWNTNVYAQEKIDQRTKMLVEYKEMSTYHAQTMKRLTGIVSLFHDMIEENIMTAKEVFSFLESLWIPRYYTVTIENKDSDIDLYRCIERSNETFARETVEEPLTDALWMIGISLCSEDDRRYLTTLSCMLENESDFWEKESWERKKICKKSQIPVIHSVICWGNTYQIDLSRHRLTYEKTNFRSIEQAKTIYVDEQTELNENTLAEAMVLTAVLEWDKKDNATYLNNVHLYLSEHHPKVLKNCHEQLCSIPGWREYYAEYIRSKVKEQKKFLS